MREAIHIFMKDSRHLRVPIAIVLAWTTIFLVASATPIWPLGQLQGWSSELVFALLYFSPYVLPAGWWFLIARAFHSDAIPGDRQFWLTRPYRRSSLFGAKALFVLAYVTIPMALAQIATVIAWGFPLGRSVPGVMWSQGLLLVVIVLPAAALAALTSKLTQFIVVALAAAPLLIVSNLLTPWGALEWIRASVAIGIVAIVTSVVLYVQFAHRRTGVSRLIVLAGMLMLSVSLPILPWRTAFALQSQIGSDGALTVDLVRRPEPREVRPPFAGGPLTFQLTGLPAGTPIACEAAEATIESQDGIWKTDLEIAAARTISKIEDGCFLLLSDAIINAVGSRQVSIHAVLYVTAFGPERLTRVPITEHPTVVQDAVLCNGATRHSFVRSRSGTTDVDNSMTFVACRSAFRDPRELIQLTSPVSAIQAVSRFSYSPFPADLGLDPVGSVVSFNTRPVEEMTLAIREPLTHTRAIVDVKNVRLQDVLR